MYRGLFHLWNKKNFNTIYLRTHENNTNKKKKKRLNYFKLQLN